MKKALILVGVALFISLGAMSPTKAMTTSELNAQIAALQAQIAALQAQIASSQQQTSIWCPVFNKNLRIGDFGDKVADLGTALEEEGFSIGERLTVGDMRNFDERMASAVVAFQQKYKDEILTPLGLKYGTGYVGSSTRAKLNTLYASCRDYYPAPWPAITVISPNGGETFVRGKNITITWNDASERANYVDIDLLDYGRKQENGSAPLVLDLATDYPTQNRTYNWQIYPDWPTGNLYKIRVTSSDFSRRDESDNYFSIVSSESKPVYTVSQTTLTRGLTYTLAGSVSNGLPNSVVKFYLQRPDGTMEYSGITVAPSGVICFVINCSTKTDANGNFAYQTKVTIPKEGQNGTWTSWVTVDGIESNKIYSNVSPAVQEKGSLLLNLSPETPLSQTIMPGASYSFIKFKLTANEFEDIKVNSLWVYAFFQTTIKPYNISDIKLYDGSVVLASSQQDAGGGTSATIPFSNLNLIIPKGSSKTLTIRAAVSVKGATSCQFAVFGSNVYGFDAIGLTSLLPIESSGRAVGNIMNFEILKPNLTVSGIKFYPAGKTDTPENEIPLVDMYKYVGTRVVAKAVMVNTGAAFTKVFNVKWFLDEQQVGYGSHSGMAANETSNGNVRFDWTVLPCGTHNFTFKADVDNHVAESNENDNSSSVAVVSTSITVLSPNGGERWNKVGSYQISWKSSGNMPQVSIYANDLLGNSKDIAKIITNSGSYKWTIPSDFIFGNYKINIIEPVFCADAARDESDNYFSIVAPSIQPSINILSPNGGEKWSFGNAYDITWNATGVDKVNIELEKWAGSDGVVYSGGPFTQIIEENITASSGKYSWPLGHLKGGTITSSGSYYKIRVVMTGDNSPYSLQIADSSNNYFKIGQETANQIAFSYPSGGEKLEIGKNYNITWNGGDNISTYPVYLKGGILGAGGKYLGIAYASQKSFLWVISSDITIGSGYYIQFGIAPNMLSGTSNQFEIISAVNNP